VACKENIAKKINSFLTPLRDKRAYFEARPEIVAEAVRAGNERTREEAKETIRMVREAMHFDYSKLLEGERVATR